MIRVIGLALLAAVAAAPREIRADDQAPLRSESPPFFHADLAIALDSTGTPSVGVAINVSFSEFQWVKAGDAFASAAEFTVSLESRRHRIFGGTWERRISVGSFEATRSSLSTFAERRSFPVPPGDYDVRITVSDRNGEQSALARGAIEVPDFDKAPVGFAALELGTVDSTGAFVLSPSREFGIEVKSLAARVTIFDRRGGDWPRDYPIRYRLLDDRGEELLKGASSLHAGRSGEPAMLRPSNTNFFVGSYTLEIELLETKSKLRISRSFEVEESGPPQGREFERMLEPLAYIADSREIDILRALPAEEQARGWEEFWKRRDPTPETVRNEAMLEFLRRVSYADRHFQGFGPGWRSDMGRVYIKHGPPDQTESRPATAQTPQLEIWYYGQPYRRFVFADREGFGRYVLVSPVE